MHICGILRQLNGLFNFHLNRDRNECWSKFISRLPTGSKKFRRLSRALRGNKSPYSDLQVNSRSLKTSTERANALADVFWSAHTITINNASPLDITVADYIHSLDRVSDFREGAELTNMNEVKAQVLQLKSN